MDHADVPRHRPLAFDKMESLIKEMQDPETGVPVRSQKLFLTYIPAAFMGYDLVEWLMERFNLDETSNVEAINLANQLCQYGYFFPVNDSKNLILKDDSSLYRFQSPYYWPWQAPKVAGSASAPSLGPDNVEYAIYLVKRTLRNKQRHGLEDYELEALANLKKNLAAKWDFITMQAEEQVRLAKERKKGDKIVSDSQERAYWRVARPPPGMPNALEHCPVPVRARHPTRTKKRTIQQVTREIEHLKASLDRTRVKTSIALEALLAYSETFAPYDPWLTPPQPSNPWVSDDTLYWQINSPLVEVPSEKRVQRWALSIEELIADPTGLEEFTSFLRKEYSHENIRFWLAVMDLRRSSTRQIPAKLDDIYQEFLRAGAPCEINIDGATAERVAEGLRSGSRYALDHAADHVYGLLLKKDCYPRFIRSDHFQRLLAEGKNVLQKKAKFFNFGGQVKKKPGPTTGSAGPGSGSGSGSGSGPLSRRRGSDRSLSGSAHELAVCAAQPVRTATDPPPHSHSQSNLCDIPRDALDDESSEVLPWECMSRDGGCGGSTVPSSGAGARARRRQDSAADSGSSSSDLSATVVSAGTGGAAAGAAGAGTSERRRLPQQSTLDGGLRGAPPPLRRLSAVEPRHLAPLVSPPHSPRTPPLPAAVSAVPAPPPHPTPTISVSSAPDDESPPRSPASPPCSPEEARSLAISDEPSSVFASADVTPTDPARPPLPPPGGAPYPSGEAPGCDFSRTDDIDSEAEVTVRSAELEPDAGSSPRRDCARDDDFQRGSLPRDPSTIRKTSPASNNDTSSEIGDLPESSREPEQVAPSSIRTAGAADSSVLVAKAPETIAVLSTIASASTSTSTMTSIVQVADSTSPAVNVAASGVEVAVTTSTVAATVTTVTTNVTTPASPVAVSAVAIVPRGPVAPLAVCEDVGVDDDNVEKVPSAPLQRVSVDSEAASELNATETFAHKDELPSVTEHTIVKRDNNKSSTGERKQRNDICPWEDENSCESEAPFVKTYATLGYL